MIKTENGKVEVKGTTPEIMADLESIISALNETKLHGIDEGKNKEMILDVVNDGLTPVEDMLKSKIDEISNGLGSLFEELAKKLKGTGEE